MRGLQEAAWPAGAGGSSGSRPSFSCPRCSSACSRAACAPSVMDILELLYQSQSGRGSQQQWQVRVAVLRPGHRPQARGPDSVRSRQAGRNVSNLRAGRVRGRRRSGAGVRVQPDSRSHAARAASGVAIRGHQHRPGRDQFPRDPSDCPGLRKIPWRLVHRLYGQQRGGRTLRTRHGVRPLLAKPLAHSQQHFDQVHKDRAVASVVLADAPGRIGEGQRSGKR